MRIRWPRWFRRKEREQPRTILRRQQYMIRFIIGGKPYYMKWDAWERDSTGHWVMLTQEQMAVAILEWIKSDTHIVVGRSGANVAMFKTSSIEEFEVIDNSYFDLDV